MIIFTILTPCEKIRNIREQLGFEVDDIACPDVPKNLIDAIENNKITLIENVAKILASRINNLCKERNIDFSVTEEYLLEDAVSQAKKVADEYISYIDNLPQNEIVNASNKLTEIDIFLKGYDTEEKKSILYKTIAKKFIDIKLYYKAMNYYLKAYESSTNENATINILIKLGACCTYLSKYEDALKYYKMLLNLSKDVQPSYVAKFNIALCNKKLKNYDISLIYLYDLKESFKKIPPTVIKQYEVYNLIGICLLGLNSFDKAIDAFKEILENSPSEKEETFTLSNLADIYRVTNDCKNLKEICYKLKSKMETNVNFLYDYESNFYISLAKNLNHIGDIKAYETLLLKALESFKLKKSNLYFEDIEDIFSNLLNIFIEASDIDKIEFLKDEFLNLAQKEMITNESEIALKFINYYSSTKEFNKIKNMMNLLLS